MAIVVTHKEKGGRFVVLGASYSEWRTARGSAVFGELLPVERSGSSRCVVVCGKDGVIQFPAADDLVVVSIDGRPPADVLGDA